jgi:hypothetical protein
MHAPSLPARRIVMPILADDQGQILDSRRHLSLRMRSSLGYRMIDTLPCIASESVSMMQRFR